MQQIADWLEKLGLSEYTARFAESDTGAQSWVAAFREELGKFGWTEGRNIEITPQPKLVA